MKGSGLYEFKPRFTDFPTFIDRLIAIASYLTGGLVGLIIIIYTTLTGKFLKSYLKFHIYQSIFIPIVLYVFNLLLSILMGFVRFIPIVGFLINNYIYNPLFEYPLIFGYSIVVTVFYIFWSYLIITALLGKYSEVPWVSKIVKDMM